MRAAHTVGSGSSLRSGALRPEVLLVGGRGEVDRQGVLDVGGTGPLARPWPAASGAPPPRARSAAAAARLGGVTWSSPALTRRPPPAPAAPDPGAAGRGRHRRSCGSPRTRPATRCAISASEASWPRCRAAMDHRESPRRTTTSAGASPVALGRGAGLRPDIGVRPDDRAVHAAPSRAGCGHSTPAAGVAVRARSGDRSRPIRGRAGRESGVRRGARPGGRWRRPGSGTGAKPGSGTGAKPGSGSGAEAPRTTRGRRGGAPATPRARARPTRPTPSTAPAARRSRRGVTTSVTRQRHRTDLARHPREHLEHHTQRQPADPGQGRRGHDAVEPSSGRTGTPVHSAPGIRRDSPQPQDQHGHGRAPRPHGAAQLPFDAV